MSFAQRRRVHLIAGGRYHDFDFARLELLQLLAELPQIRTSVTSSWGDLTSLAESELLITYTCDIAPSLEEAQALQAFLQRGGKWIALHGTNAILEFAEGRIYPAKGHDLFMELLGTRFVAHPAHHVFAVEVREPAHPLVAGIGGFELFDELYLYERTGNIRPLLETRFTGDCSPYAAAIWQDELAPVLYLHDVGPGSVFYLSLGHARGHYDPSGNGAIVPHPARGAWSYPVFYELLRRGLRWGLELA